ncbi:MAG: hypothetical protein JW845_03490 [Dehalococcoidales bacterium]|nr:hypothetical protein [Dehalococcoidales bacterium]
MTSIKRASFLHSISIFLIMAFFLGIIMTGCSGYKEVTLTRKGIQFSFEYPSSYEEFCYSFQSEDFYVGLVRYSVDSQERLVDRKIDIYIFKTDIGRPDATSSLNSFLENRVFDYEEFQLLERSSVKVSGIDGELIIYSGYYDIGYFISEHLKVWAVYLDYKDIIWILIISSAIDTSDGAEAEFQHFIDTFRFLN